MSNAISATRYTCFALIASLEVDLRNLIRSQQKSNTAQPLLHPALRQLALNRFIRASESLPSDEEPSDTELLDYIDFSDAITILAGRAGQLDPIAGHISEKLESLASALAPIRNRVCHARPLEPEDFATLVDACRDLHGLQLGALPELGKTLGLLKASPASLLHTVIPDFWGPPASRVMHNLPAPEFEDTGFLGRAKDRRAVNLLLRSHYPVVTIVGEGGVGKTALAQRCLYDLLEADGAGFDAIVWYTLKTAALSAVGIRELSATIPTTLSLISGIARELGGMQVSGRAVADQVDEIVEYLENYRVLLAIDNLETVSTEPLRNLLRRIPGGSRVLFTSRIGIGEYEARYVLEPLDVPTAVQLIRLNARAAGLDFLSEARREVLGDYAQKLFLNPLLLKWFVAGVARGADPKTLLHTSGKPFRSALAFCLEDLYRRLGEHELGIIHALMCARRALTLAEITFLVSAFDAAQVEAGMLALHNSSLVRRTASTDGSIVYALSDSALTFLASVHSPSRAAFDSMQGRLREMQSVTEVATVEREVYKLEIFSVRAEARDEKIAAIHLTRALAESRQSDIQKARRCVEDARAIMPEFSEVHRVAAIVETAAQDYHRAVTAYELAIECNPDSIIARYSYAQFLLSYIEDFAGALVQLTAAEARDPIDPTLKTAKALVLMRLGRLQEAHSIYRDVLASLASRPKRWRLSTVDQAAECFRRMAEVSVQNHDMPLAKQQCDAAFQLLREAMLRGDSDVQMLRRTAKVAAEALKVASIGRDREYALTVIRRALDLLSTEFAFDPRTVESWARSLRWIGTDGEVASMLEQAWWGRNVLAGVDALRDTGNVASVGRGGVKLRGTVFSIHADKGFGFIDTESGGRLFFHSHGVTWPTTFEVLKAGDVVTYRDGANKHGPCAVHVARWEGRADELTPSD
jgi:LuxR family transcriptional regulator, glucitol operon activator